MKKLLSLVLFLSTMVGIAQNGYNKETFTWEVTDSVHKTKPQIYSDTKLFIAEMWKSAQSVIQLDDKEGGQILIKGIQTQQTMIVIADVEYIFSYTIKFLMKEGKYKMIIDNVQSTSVYYNKIYKWPVIGICDGCDKPDKQGISKKKYNLIISNLKENLQNIVNSYELTMKKESLITKDW